MTTQASRNARAVRWWLLVLLAAAPLAVLAQQAAPTQERSVKPGINNDWKGENVKPLLDRLETESREIYVQRESLAGLVGPKVGAVVADVGAGSGFMTELFARLVGSGGKVYAEDINPKLLEHIAQRAAGHGLKNVQTVLGTEKSVELPANSVDIVFLCDTYHHFEYPKSMMNSIHRALRTGGQVVLVEFRRVDGASPQWMMEHVRAGQEVFTKELTEFGFELINEHTVPWLKENYVLRFRKADARR